MFIMVMMVLGLIYIFFYNNMIIFLLISFEILNFTILMILVQNLNIIFLYMSLVIQVSESVILMLLLLENYSIWKNFSVWNLFF